MIISVENYRLMVYWRTFSITNHHNSRFSSKLVLIDSNIRNHSDSFQFSGVLDDQLHNLSWLPVYGGFCFDMQPQRICFDYGDHRYKVQATRRHRNSVFLRFWTDNVICDRLLQKVQKILIWIIVQFIAGSAVLTFCKLEPGVVFSWSSASWAFRCV